MFIVFEGGEGSGKTTVIKEIKKVLDKNRINHISIREPGGVDISEQIREVILNKENTKMTGETEALLYASARSQLINEIIEPALKNNICVLCDRFVTSSLVYQGLVRGVGVDKVKKINEIATKGIEPDIIFYLDVPPEVGLSRINKNSNREVNRLDLENIEFHRKVRAGYKTLSASEKNIVYIDANTSIENVVNDICCVLRAKGINLAE